MIIRAALHSRNCSGDVARARAALAYPRVARCWYEMAAAQGDSSARKLLGNL